MHALMSLRLDWKQEPAKKATLHWFYIHLTGCLLIFRINHKILVLTFRALDGQAPKYISDLLTLYRSSWALRTWGQNVFVAPKTHYETQEICVFSQWLLDFCVADSPDWLKRQLKIFLLGMSLPP